MGIQGKTRIYEIPSDVNTPESEGFPSLLQSQYNFNSHVFPSDLGMSDSGHYAVFNINIQTNIKGEKAGYLSGGFNDLQTLSKVDQLRYRATAGSPTGMGSGKNSGGYLNQILEALKKITPGVPLPGLPGGIPNFLRDAYIQALTNLVSGEVGVFIPRSTTRIAESIALHMPTPLIFNTHNVYEEVSLTALAGKGLGIAVTQGARSFLQTAGQVAQAGAKLAQRPINPLVEILFATTAPRQFTFEVLMAPRNQKESESIKSIIRAFRFHGAPEVSSASLGLLWIPPAEFDITFFNKGVENVNILRINTCVLERIEVDYAPTSGMYSTFRNGHPVAVRLSLGFRELEPISKRRVLQGF